MAEIISLFLASRVMCRMVLERINVYQQQVRTAIHRYVDEKENPQPSNRTRPFTFTF